MSKCQHLWPRTEKRKGKIDRNRERGRRRQGGEEKRMMKNKVNARAAATGQRSISLLLLKGLVDGGKDKG